jgi:hypothetical protein
MTTLGQWAAESETADFAAVGLVDHLVYDNLDPLTALAAAAARTERVELFTTDERRPHGKGCRRSPDDAGDCEGRGGREEVEHEDRPGGVEGDAGKRAVEAGSKRFHATSFRVRSLEPSGHSIRERPG